MFNVNENEIKISLEIIPKSPLLIKANDDVQEKGNIIQWNRTVSGKEPFIPGSTLKGMLKDIFYTIWYDYFNLEEDKFKEVLEENYKNDHKVYDYEDYMVEVLKERGEDIFLEKSLKISKLFGAKNLKSRLHIGDASFKDDGKVEKERLKSITPIDRFTGGAVVPLQFEYTCDPFITEIIIKNIEKDELKTLLFAIRDSIDGEVRIGSSKTRGFGEIELAIKNFQYKEFKNSSLTLDSSNFSLDEKKSLKLGDSYLYKVYKLEKSSMENFEILKKVVG
ncbi:CRISPR/Cas system CSM-associated protein Csm3, group 7 of RAMP superfamily [Cetobacterium ceti]|uniref:CRISPR/Cas system CSM-associated protein Csm3, group 7 of RAMP superfamily n=1 Tax=Cetobacterium ceti TaxID=180163 RepID=A0A1T4NQF7_9FUSO|nr:RAMP superfamily CRISPR-associated protein [Cetobacterium ceti]SJZ81439.1 CRISPR/Cas system CSM-associated protein Csm3, group 7 of RAMP superfamily [Cetobacterium ceti]